MLHQLDESLKRVLQRRGVTEPIVFDTPDGEWGARISQPTLNLFLWDIRRSMDQSEGRELVERESGGKVWRRQRPRIEFHYLITAWTTVVGDEHRLLGDALVAILGCEGLTGSERPAFVSEGDPVATIRVARADGKDLSDFWGAIDGKLKPGLNVVVTVSVDPGINDPAGAATTTYELRTGMLAEDESLTDVSTVSAVGWEHESVGAEVHAAGSDSRRGVARVLAHAGAGYRNTDDGKTTYLVKGRPGDRITITTRDGVVEEYEFPPPRAVVTEQGRTEEGEAP